MSTMKIALALLALLAAAPQARPSADQTPTKIQNLTARTVRTFPVPEANQGVAVDARHFYAVDDTIIAKYEIASGRRVAGWTSSDGLIRHLNSCFVDAARLVCTNSNYPQIPMASSVEIFDAATMKHVESHSFGLLDEGSLTWLDKYRGGWIAGFAHYDKEGGLPFKDHRYSSVVTYDAEWRRTGGWLLPADVLERMAPSAASGGAIGPDGWLYLLGHDRPEMYVVARPSMGPALIHIATITLEAEGQAFAWAQDGSRTAFTIDRRRRLVRTVALPQVTPADPSVSLRFR